MLYEGSLSYVLEKEPLKVFPLGTFVKLKNDNITKVMKGVISCKAKFESLKELKKEFDEDFTKGLVKLKEVGAFSFDEGSSTFKYELKSEHQNSSGKCEPNKNKNPLKDQPSPFDYKGGRGTQ
eukprot:CAMPEP_0170524142 /NCGR_PEP_ID=MMETSP0209-20121228/9556_1 /TAXON_ID=665100 ORGANISM="Litonotus pictus, Strain P1" /NCGR_SAMPLE_ID=MMETSP0209 /ASSEMBLY_ACC=CAM_ASM_000301 /LENGTH=122 /DNA_ID=CAMNT_0010812637 /DNA_START=141 /DNA_END=512 /DNA_ORIENTATION=+